MFIFVIFVKTYIPFHSAVRCTKRHTQSVAILIYSASV